MTLEQAPQGGVDVEREIVIVIAKAMQTWDRNLASPDSEPMQQYLQAAKHVVDSLESKGYELKSPAAV
jgi:hypothetical protein